MYLYKVLNETHKKRVLRVRIRACFTLSGLELVVSVATVANFFQCKFSKTEFRVS